MAAPKTTIWPLEPHTRAKHAILKRYLEAWTAILSLGGFPEIVYIDGFAGPGRYSKGEDGSPVIALEVALEQRLPSDTRILFLFVEQDEKRAAVLEEIVNSIERPERFCVSVAGGKTFESAVRDLLNSHKAKGTKLPPTFTFIDPFGWKGVKFSIVEEILSYPSCEVLLTFMYEEINRFIGEKSQTENFDDFFGTSKWRDCLSIGEPRARNRFLHDRYVDQLRSAAKVNYVRSFEMRNDKDVTDYYLFYGTNNLKGLQKMKEAMWKVDASGEFKFSDATDPNQRVFFAEPAFEILQAQIVKRFAGLETTVGDVQRFVLAETAFRETHYKRRVLHVLESALPPRLEAVDPPKNRRKGTYGDPTMKLRFVVT